MRHEWASRARWVLLIVLVGVLLGLVMGATKAPDLRTPPFARQLQEAEEARRQGKYDEAARLRAEVLATHYRVLDYGLAIQEQTDFLLTPALLVQEAVSDDVILTYPEE